MEENTSANTSKKLPMGLLHELQAVVSRKLELVDATSTVGTVLKEKKPPDFPMDFSAQTASVLDGPWSSTNQDMSIEDIHNFGVKFLKATAIVEDELSVDEAPSSTSSRGALDILMQSARKRFMPKKKLSSSGVRTGLSSKDEIYNDLIEEFDVNNWKFLTCEEGDYVIQVLTNTFWALSIKTLDEAHDHDRRVKALPRIADVARKIMFKRPKKMKVVMSVGDLEQHSGVLLSLLQRASVRSERLAGLWSSISDLAECLDSYVVFLKEKGERMSTVRPSATPLTQISENVSVEWRPPAQTVSPDLFILNRIVEDSSHWEPIGFDETLHSGRADGFRTRQERYKFFERIALSNPLLVIRYSPGGPHKTSLFLAKVPLDASADERSTQIARITARLIPELPQYHSREMRKVFAAKVANIADVRPAVLSYIYSELTGDATSPANKGMQERLQLAAMGEPGIIPDLRHYNTGRPGETFDPFWQEMEKVVNEVTVADDRRHGVAHFSEWLSVKDLITQTRERCPEGTLIPSESLVRLQFTPTNKFTKRAQSFTCRFAVQRKIQRRQLRGTHSDAHFCAAQYRYMRELAVRIIDDCHVFFMDDKAKIPVGEPDTPVSTGVRARSGIAPSTSVLGAADHDVNTLGKLTPTVTLMPDIPETVDGSWYQGRVGVTYHDTATQVANPFRYAAIVKEEICSAGPKPILFKLSDGGSEHNNTHVKVQLSLIALFKELNLDMLVAARTAPGQSFLNPCERVMSLLNLALQNVATSRAAMDRRTEETLGRCHSLNELRQKLARDDDLVIKWKESMEPVIDLVETRTRRLTLKERPVLVRQPVDEALIITRIGQMFPTLPDARTVTMKQAQSDKSFMEFREKHCRLRQYNFQIRKCDDISCCMPATTDTNRRQWLPDPVLSDDAKHYKKLGDVLGTDTMDSDRPSAQSNFGRRGTKFNDPFMTAELEAQKKNPLLFTQQTARLWVECEECRKPRVIYAKKKLTSGELSKLRGELSKLRGEISEFGFSCGSLASLEVPVAQPRISLTCGDPIEKSYYKAKNLSNRQMDLCASCAESGAEVDANLQQRFRTVLPCCATCLATGKKPLASVAV